MPFFTIMPCLGCFVLLLLLLLNVDRQISVQLAEAQIFPLFFKPYIIVQKFDTSLSKLLFSLL